MDFSSLDYRPYKYRVNKLTLNIGGFGSYDVDAQFVTSIRIEKDYDNYVFPYLEIGIQIPNNVFRAMHKNNIECRALFAMDGGFGSSDYGDANSDNNIAWENWFSQEFYVMSDDSTSDVTENINEASEKENGSYNSPSISDMCSTFISLYNESYLFNLRKTVDAPLNSIKVIDAEAYLLKKAGVSRVLCSPPFNNTKYTQLIIPPKTIIENLDYMANNYAMHQCGTVVFFDWDRGYLIDKNSKCTAWEPNECKTVYISSYNMGNVAESYKGGCYRDTASCVINIQAGSANFSTPSVVNDQTYGSNIVMIDSKSGNISSTQSKATASKNGGTTSVYVSNSGENTSKAIAQTLREASKQATISFEGVDLEMLRPNKEFTMAMDSSELNQYAGNYRCAKYICIMASNGTLFTPNIQATFLGYDIT